MRGWVGEVGVETRWWGTPMPTTHRTHTTHNAAHMHTDIPAAKRSRYTFAPCLSRSIDNDSSSLSVAAFLASASRSSLCNRGTILATFRR